MVNVGHRKGNMKKPILTLLLVLVCGAVIAVFMLNRHEEHIQYDPNGSIRVQHLDVQEGQPPVEIVFMKAIDGEFREQRVVTVEVGNGILIEPQHLSTYLQGISAEQRYYVSLRKEGEEFDRSKVFSYTGSGQQPISSD